MDLSHLQDCLIEEGLQCREPEPLAIKAGRVELSYDNGYLRSLLVNRVEILRRIHFALRDANWGTVTFARNDEIHRITEDNFEIRYRALFGEETALFEAELTLSGNASGRIEWLFSGRALGEFQANRIGFTVLHPLAGFLGTPIRLVHSDGSSSTAGFPVDVSPHQPFRDLTAMEWQFNGGVARLDFYGEIFETEDQRNWVDGSFKTYCTPLERPFPVTYRRGDTVEQRLVLTVACAPVAIGSARDCAELQLTIGKQWSAFPCIGFSFPAIEAAQSGSVGKHLRRLRPDHLRIELGSAPSGKPTPDINATLQLVAEMGCALELALFAEDSETLDSLLDDLAAVSSARVSRVLLLGSQSRTTPAALLRQSTDAVRRRFASARIGAGTDAFFAELNRQPVPTEGIDFISFSLNPQVHAVDRVSWIETLEAHAHVVATAQRLAAGKAVAVGPLTLRMRWNPNATQAQSALAPGGPPQWLDPRQFSLFAAGWAMASISQLASAGVESVTAFDAVGEGGLMLAGPTRYADHFPLPPDCLFPLYFVFAEMAGARSFLSLLVAPLQSASAMLLATPYGVRLLAANHTPSVQYLALPRAFFPRCMRLLDAARWRRFALHPDGYFMSSVAVKDSCVALPPFAFAAIDGEMASPPC